MLFPYVVPVLAVTMRRASVVATVQIRGQENTILRFAHALYHDI